MSSNAHRQARQRREWLAASKHVLRGVAREAGPEGPGEYLECTCGWSSPEQPCWHDDCVVSDVATWGHAPAILVYPGPEDHADMSMGGIVRVAENGSGRRIPTRDLNWLVEQVDVPEVLRESAARVMQDRARAMVTGASLEPDVTVRRLGVRLRPRHDGAGSGHDGAVGELQDG